MSKIQNSVVLVTGGAAGIGRLIAERCVQEGASQIILWDIDAVQLEATKGAFREKGQIIYTDVVDVSDMEAIITASERVLADIGPVDILFNNAGIVVGKPFVEHSHGDIQRTNDINIGGVMHMARAFLPGMLHQKRGHIINIASAAGLMPNPNMTVYAGSKWAVVGWSESLRLELEEQHPEVKVTTVTPSYINTGMFDGVKAPALTPIMEPDYVVDKIIQAVKEDKIILREPFMVKTLPILRGLLPTRVFDLVAGKFFGVYKSMQSFKGHTKKGTTKKETQR